MRPLFTSRFVSKRFFEELPSIQGVSFSTRSFSSKSGEGEKPDLNILFFCPRNEDHFRKFKTEYPDFIHESHPKSVSISDIAHNPRNNETGIRSLIGSNVPPSLIIPHLVLIGHTKQEADDKIRFFKENGINSVIAIRGNPATVKKDISYMSHPEGYEDMPQLMRRIKDIHPEMKIIVAAYPNKHPYARTFSEDMDELKRKVDHGADMIVTQHFFDNNVFLGFLDECEKRNIRLPMIPSIMPLGNPKYLFSFSRSANVDIPAEVSQILFSKDGVTTESESIKDKDVRARALEYTANQIRSLVDLRLPQIDRINTYAANNIPFLRDVLSEVGVLNSRTDSKDGGRS
jgi:methylenetetrahydrofolate reductase (NADPH)